MQTVERTLQLLAGGAKPIPNNPELGLQIGVRRQSIQRAIDQLARAGRIQIETRQGQRRIYVEAVQRSTSWGEARPGHAPYCKTPKGAPPPEPKQRARQLQTVILFAGSAVHIHPIELGRVLECQWPIASDAARHGTYSMCGGKTVPGKSYCPTHHAAGRLAGGTKAA